MKPFNFIVNVIIILILLFLIFKGQNINKKFDKTYLILFVLLISLLCLCSYKSVENLENVENKVIYDYDKATTKNLKVVKKIEGLSEQMNSLIPIGFVYLTIKKDFDPNIIFGGTWTRLNPDSGDINGNMFLMIAQGEDAEYESNNKLNCAFNSVVDEKCPEKSSFDVITNIEYSDNRRIYGGLNEIQLTADNLPPHNHYLRGDKEETLNGDGSKCPSGHPQCSNCYNRVKFGFYIDQQKAVGGNPSGKKDKNNLRRIRSNKEDGANAYTTRQVNANFKNDNYTDQYSKQSKVEAHSNVPPYIMIYGWKKTGN